MFVVDEALLARLQRLAAFAVDVGSEELDGEAVTRLTTRSAMSLIGCAGAAVAFPEGNELVYRDGEGLTAAASGIRLPIDRESLTARAFLDGEVTSTANGLTEPHTNHEAFRKGGWQSAVCVPVGDKGSIRCVLTLNWVGAGAFTPIDVELARLLGIGLANALSRIERRQMSRTLRRHDRLIKLLFEAAPLNMGIVELAGDNQRFQAINQTAASLLGRSVDEIAGHLATEVGVSPATAAYWAAKFRESEAEGRPVEVQFRSDRGYILRGMLSALPSEPGEPTHFCFVTENVTERESLREQLATADRRAVTGQLAVGLAHELKTPLSYVKSNLTYVQREAQKVLEGLPESARDDFRTALEDSLEGVERLRSTMESMLAYTRTAPTPERQVDLREVARQAIRMAQPFVVVRAELVQDLAETPPVFGDPIRLTQVVINLMMNASQAQHADQRRHEVRVATGRGGDGSAFMEVADTGCGISAENLPRLFKPFFTTKGPTEGTGLGLSICKDIVESQRGRLEVTSAPGQGTAFRVVLPHAS